MIINNNDPMEQQEESTIQTQDYGSVRYMRSSWRELGSVGYTVCTEDGTMIETDTSNTRMHTINLSVNEWHWHRYYTTTRNTIGTNKKSKSSTGRKTPSVVNIVTQDGNLNPANDELTTDGNTASPDSVQTINKLHDVIKYFGRSNYTMANLPSRLGRKYESKLHEKDKRKYTQMINKSTGCIRQVLKSVCPGPSRKQLKHDVGTRLRKVW